jgi:hypothetical protein
LIPLGDGHRYDLVVDTPGGLRKVQCKSGRITKGKYPAISYKNYSSSFRRVNRTTTRYTVNEVDFLCVHVAEINSTFLIPTANATGHIGLKDKTFLLPDHPAMRLVL